MPRFKVTVVYDGTDFVGWQRQAAGVSIQGVLEDALRALDEREVAVIGAGRTDAGVHALGQVASFTLVHAHSADTVVRALNARLPETVRVVDAAEVPASFHAQFDAHSKTYRYRIWTGNVLSPFERGYVWHLPGALDVDAMRAAATLVEGEHDFAAFQASGSDAVTTVRRVLASRIAERGMRIDADRGLRIDADRGLAIDTQPGSRIDADRGLAIDTQRGSRIDADRGLGIDTERGSRIDADRGLGIDTERGSRIDADRGLAIDRERRSRIDADRGTERGSRIDAARRLRVGADGLADDSAGRNPHSALVEYEITGTGFLRHMVRVVVGSLVEVGRRRQPVEWMTHVLASRDRAAAGQTAPALGLFLVRVRYGDSLASDA